MTHELHALPNQPLQADAVLAYARNRAAERLDSQGRYLAKAAHDVRMALARDGLEWFRVFDDQSQVLRILREGDPSEALWGFGARGSPARLFLLEQLGAKT